MEALLRCYSACCKATKSGCRKASIIQTASFFIQNPVLTAFIPDSWQKQPIKNLKRFGRILKAVCINARITPSSPG